MSGVLVLAETREPADAGVGAATHELIAAGRALARKGAGPLSVALLVRGAGTTGDRHADARTSAQIDALAVDGVEEVLVVPSPHPRFEAHVAQAALAALIEQRTPALVLAAHTLDSLNVAPALAARGGHGFACDVTGVSWGDDGALARHAAHGERPGAELEFPGKRTVVLLLRPGAFAATSGVGGEGGGVSGDDGAPAQAASDVTTARVTRVELDLAGAARTERVELRDAPGGDVDITQADFLLALGRGVGGAENVARMQRLAERLGATVSVSGALVEAGLAPGARKVGLSGKTVAPRVYLALGISGAAQHVGGMSRAQTIIAVNSDPQARIFDVAHYGAVADLFAVADALERELG